MQQCAHRRENSWGVFRRVRLADGAYCRSSPKGRRDSGAIRFQTRQASYARGRQSQLSNDRGNEPPSATKTDPLVIDGFFPSARAGPAGERPP
jgi:hypothetical protein